MHIARNSLPDIRPARLLRAMQVKRIQESAKRPISADIPIKVIIVGNQCVGKSKICYELITQRAPRVPPHNGGYFPTIGVEVHIYNDAKGRSYNLWDTAGNPDFIGLESGYYIHAEVALIVTGPADREQMDGDRHLGEWKNLIHQTVPGIPIHIVSTMEEARDALANH